jgi:hypothetical protein
MADSTDTSGTDEGVQETPEQVAAREAQEADAQSQEDDAKGGELARARQEAARYRTQLRDVQTNLKKLQDEKLSDSEKLAKQLNETTELNGSLLDQNRTLRVQLAATKVGINPDLADAVPSMLDWSSIEDGDAKGLEKALKDLVKERPSLAGAVAGGSDAGEGRRDQQQPKGDMNSILRRAAGRE